MSLRLLSLFSCLLVVISILITDTQASRRLKATTLRNHRTNTPTSTPAKITSPKQTTSRPSTTEKSTSPKAIITSSPKPVTTPKSIVVPTSKPKVITTLKPNPVTSPKPVTTQKPIIISTSKPNVNTTPKHNSYTTNPYPTGTHKPVTSKYSPTSVRPNTTPKNSSPTVRPTAHPNIDTLYELTVLGEEELNLHLQCSSYRLNPKEFRQSPVVDASFAASPKGRLNVKLHRLDLDTKPYFPIYTDNMQGANRRN